jgi:hypothetical protein
LWLLAVIVAPVIIISLWGVAWAWASVWLLRASLRTGHHHRLLGVSVRIVFQVAVLTCWWLLLEILMSVLLLATILSLLTTIVVSILRLMAAVLLVS